MVSLQDGQYFFNLGKFFYEGPMNSEPVYSQSLKLFLKADTLNNKKACEYLAHMYFYGKGTPIDKQKSAKFCEKAARYGQPEAQYRLGIMYLRGIGVKRDYQLAKKWLMKAAKSNFEAAQYVLGLIFFFGKGCKRDWQEAKIWFKKAAFLDILLLPSNSEKLSSWAIHCLTDISKKDYIIIKSLYKLCIISANKNVTEKNMEEAAKFYGWLEQFSLIKADTWLAQLFPEQREEIKRIYTSKFRIDEKELPRKRQPHTPVKIISYYED